MGELGSARKVFVVGGARSGKSSFAERYVRERSERDNLQVVYVATSQALDEEMERRVEAHRRHRPAGWLTVEEPMNLEEVLSLYHDPRYLLLVECLTLLLSNLLLAAVGSDGACLDDPQQSWQALKQVEQLEQYMEVLAEKIVHSPANVVVVSNEVGQGIVPASALGRVFRDLVGRANQAFAAVVDDVYWLVAGIPIPIKRDGRIVDWPYSQG